MLGHIVEARQVEAMMGAKVLFRNNLLWLELSSHSNEHMLSYTTMARSYLSKYKGWRWLTVLLLGYDTFTSISTTITLATDQCQMRDVL